jgi:riboflavin biosynthesis pyrimidine reductase
MVFGQTQRMLFRQLFPIPDEVEIAAHVRDFRLADAAPPDRPYTVANFVSSVDGRASVEGLSGGLGDEGDKALFAALRGVADAVLVGTGTLAAERYGRLIKNGEVRARRRAEGLEPEPLACVLTRSGRLPLDIPLFSESEARVVVFSGAPVQLGPTAAQVDVVRLAPGALDFAHALRHLRAEHGVRALLCEGGPTVLNALLREQVLDELFLTMAPKLIGGGAEIPITVGAALTEPADVVLTGVLERGGTLFLRYQRAN